MIQETLIRIAFFTYCWSLCHDISIKALECLLSLISYDYYGPRGIKEHLDALKAEAATDKKAVRRLGNMRRLLRSEVYCLFATTAGIYVFYNEYEKFPMDLLHHWGPYHCYIFEVACAHWIFSIGEDFLVGEEIINHIIPLPDERPDLYGWMLNGLMVHHVITIFAYSWCLATHKLSGLCIFGLMFEAPILLLNVRDLWACFEKEFLHPFKSMTQREVSIFIGVQYFLWHIFRTLPCLLYPLSLLIWRPQLNTVPLYSRLVYHILGLLFCFVNFELIFGIIPRVLLDDKRRAGLLSEETHLFNIRVLTGEIDETGKQLKKKRKKEDEKYVVDIENQQKGEKVGLRMMGLEAVGEHNTAEDCWVAIDGNVYDLTDFLSLHPGGSQVLLDVAGQDASKKFLEAGHSMKARKMMTKYLSGHILGRSYEQKNDVPLDAGMRGDINKPFEVGRTYITYENTSLCTVALSAVFLTFLLHACYQLGHVKGSYNLPLYYGGVAPAVGPVMSILVVSLLISLLLHKVSAYAHRTMDAQLGNTSPLRFRTCLSMLSDWRTHFSSAILLVYLISDYVILSIKYGHAIRAFRVSILITCTMELLWRTYSGNVTLPRTTTFYKFLLTCAPVVCLIGASFLDLYSVSLYISRAYSNHSVDGLYEKHSTNYKIFVVNILGSSLIRCFFVRSCGPPPHEKLDFNATFSRISLAIFYLTVLSYFSPEGWIQTPSTPLPALLSGAMNSGMTVSLLFVACAMSFSIFAQSFSKLISTTTSHFASQFYCIWLCFILWLCAPPIGFARWYSFILFMVAIKSLSFEAEVELEYQGADAAKWLYQVKQIENMIRHNISLTIHSLIAMPATHVVSFLAPKTQVKFWHIIMFSINVFTCAHCDDMNMKMYFTYPGPVMDLGPNCEYGMCYLINPSPQLKPETFQMNVGYIGDHLGDYMHTATSTKKMMQGLADDKDAGKNGFVTNMVAHFFLPERSPARKYGDYRIREINMSGWTSDKAAHDWYVKSEVHKEIVKKYYGGGLEGFSAMLATLKPPPDRPIRWDVRCRKCRFVVKGPDPGNCPHCHETIAPLPYF